MASTKQAIAELDNSQGHRIIGRGTLRALVGALGPGYLIAVGYMDPGNWVTDIAAGSRYGLELLAVILFANLIALLVQSLAVRLAIGTGLDLAQACRKTYPRLISFFLFISCQVAITACDLAEVIGTAISFNLLFDFPIIAGVLVSSVGTVAILLLQRIGRRPLELAISLLVFITAACLFWEVALVRPSPLAILHSYIPQASLFINSDKLYLALGIMGATIMPHNLYLHSALTRDARSTEGVRPQMRALVLPLADMTIALTFAFLVNSAILIIASSFYAHGYRDVSDLRQAYAILAPLLGASAAGMLFGIALLVAGQASTVTATLAGQICMEGFLNLRWHPWLVRLMTRATALVPVILIVLLAGDSALTKLLIMSQVILSIQLPFALIPLIHMCGSRRIMGDLVCSPFFLFICVVAALFLIGLNGKFLLDLV